MRPSRGGSWRSRIYVLSFPASCLHDLIAGRATWDDVFLSLRVRFEERTDRFIMHPKTLLRYMDPAVFAAVEEYEHTMQGDAVETFVLEAPRGRYLLQRLCPHAATDLERQGQVDAEAESPASPIASASTSIPASAATCGDIASRRSGSNAADRSLRRSLPIPGVCPATSLA
jgi:hypothetical protein